MKRLLLLLLAIFPLLAMAHDFEKDGIYYAITSKTDLTVCVTFKGSYSDKYSDEYFGDVNIPSSVVYNDTQYTVTAIGGDAFYHCSYVTSVNIPSSVTSIGSRAFYGCSGLTSVNIPSSVSIIDNQVFSGCSSLTTIVIPNKVTRIGLSAFSFCKGLTSVSIPNSVTRIGSGAFSQCYSLTALTIPNSVTHIEDEAFSNCVGLATLTIPNSVTSIGRYAFRGCTGKLYVNCNIPSESTISNGVFYESAFTDVEIGENVTSIGDYAFYENSSLTNVTFLGKVKSIGNSSFVACSSLKNITIPSSVIQIGEHAFYGCTSLESMTIPSSVTKIGTQTFYGCSMLEKLVVESGNNVYDSRYNCNAIIKSSDKALLYGCKNTVIPNDVTRINDDAFNGCSGLITVTIPDNVTSIGDNAFYGCTGLTSVSIPNSVTSIGRGAFRKCEGLTELSIPNSVTRIEESTFYDCRGLKSVNIPNSITMIGRSAFVRTSLTSVNISNSIRTIEEYAFYGCTSLTSVNIPNSIKRIEKSTFYGCTGLTKVNISNSVTTIADYAFGNCIGLKTIRCNAKNPPYLSSSAFYNVYKSTCALQVPAASVDAYFYADGWFEFANIEAINDPISPVVDDGSEVTEQNAAEITDFKLTLESGATFAANDGAKVELWIGGVLKGTAEKKDISLKDNVVTIKFTPASAKAGARGMLGEFWNAVAATASDDVQVEVKVAANSFKVNGEDIAEELSYTYTAKATVAEKIDQVLAIDEVEVNSDNAEPVFNINGSRSNGNTQRGFIIKNGNKVLVK